MSNEWMQSSENFETLDAREAEPGSFLPHVLSRADALAFGQGLHIIQSFEPVPLYGVLGAKGFEHETDIVSDSEYHVYFFKTPILGSDDGSMAAKTKANLDVDPERIAAIQGIVESFYKGIDVATLKAQFDTEIGSITGAEFAFVEQKMTEAGITDTAFKEHVEDLIRIFKGALAGHETEGHEAGHPLDTFRKENDAIAALVTEIRESIPAAVESFDTVWWEGALERLGEIDLHYIRKENQLFPLLEATGFDKPSTVMWQIHDDIRDGIKSIRLALAAGDQKSMLSTLPTVLDRIIDMTFKEQKILFPTSEEMLTHADWINVRRGEEEVGHCLIDSPPAWPSGESEKARTSRQAARTKVPPIPFVSPQERSPRVGAITLEEGSLTPDQISLLLRHLPMDLTFVDDFDEVLYANHPDSDALLVDASEDIAAFKSGVTDSVDSWSIAGEEIHHERNIAIRDDQGRYRGTLLSSQDVSGIRGLEGEQRLLNWE